MVVLGLEAQIVSLRQRRIGGFGRFGLGGLGLSAVRLLGLSYSLLVYTLDPKLGECAGTQKLWGGGGGGIGFRREFGFTIKPRRRKPLPTALFVFFCSG